MAKIIIKGKRGKPAVKMNKGALHRALGVPEGEPIPQQLKEEALAGKKGPKVKKMAVAGFKGILAKGRKTVAKNAAKRKGAKKKAAAKKRRTKMPAMPPMPPPNLG